MEDKWQDFVEMQKDFRENIKVRLHDKEYSQPRQSAVKEDSPLRVEFLPGNMVMVQTRDRSFRFAYIPSGQSAHISYKGEFYPLERITLKERIGDQFLEQAGKGAGAAEVKSPMPGTIFKLLKSEGDAVSQGETVIIVEAMKMENEIKAPQDGHLEKISVSVGESVANKQKLFKISREAG